MYQLIILASLIIFSSIPTWHSSAQEPEPTSTPSPSAERTQTATQAPPTITPMGNLIQQFSILSPIHGQVLQGKTPIQVFTNIGEIESMELSFSYSTDLTDTWFLIPTGETIVVDGVIAEWDTSTISDGNYKLLLVANLTDGKIVTTTIETLRVRNYSPIETNTPTPVTPTSEEEVTSSPSLTPTSTIIAATQTPFPRNPASLSTIELTYNLGKGALVTAGIFALIGLYIIIRRTYPG